MTTMTIHSVDIATRYARGGGPILPIDHIKEVIRMELLNVTMPTVLILCLYWHYTDISKANIARKWAAKRTYVGKAFDA